MQQDFRSSTPCLMFLFSVIFVGVMQAEDQALPWERNSYDPVWSEQKPLRSLSHAYQTQQSPEQNGQSLLQALSGLQAGDQLRIASGNYVLTRKATLDLAGTAQAPIRIEAEDLQNSPRISRSDAAQNLLNIGEVQPARYLLLRGLELVGGSVSIRFGNCENIWLDQCDVHHSQHGGITANTHHTRHLFLTRNHMHHFEQGTGEAMYLGANQSQAVMSFSVIAKNHVHDCGGSQGDGIEIKQGSFNNWIIENEVHDTQYPCLISYGTDGNGINLIERNVLYRSQNQVLQVQGEAIVRNNLIMAASGDGFSSTDHQGKTRNLTFVHNTILTTKRGANLSSWDNRDGMVFANNVIYSRDDLAVRFPAGCEMITVSGNVVLGGVQGCGKQGGFSKGKGLIDFVNANWEATERDVHPSKNSSLRNVANAVLIPGAALDGIHR